MAVILADRMLTHFRDVDGGFWDTADDGEPLVIRPRNQQDNATPSGGAMAATVLHRLASLTGEARYREAAERALATVGPFLAQYPTAFAQWLCALETAHAGITEVAIIGTPEDPGTAKLLRVVNRAYRPFTVVASTPDAATSAVPLLALRFALHGRPTGFVCRDFACRMPVNEPEALEALLAGA